MAEIATAFRASLTAEFAKAVIARWGVPDRRGKTNRWWIDFFFESGLQRINARGTALTVEEFEEFLGVCKDAGVAKEAELRTFKAVLGMIERHGDDGHGDKPAEMSRIVYWFQHVDNTPARRSELRERSPRRQHD